METSFLKVCSVESVSVPSFVWPFQFFFFHVIVTEETVGTVFSMKKFTEGVAEQFFAWSQARTFAICADADTVSHVKLAVLEVVPADQVTPLSQLN